MVMGYPNELDPKSQRLIWVSTREIRVLVSRSLLTDRLNLELKLGAESAHLAPPVKPLRFSSRRWLRGLPRRRCVVAIRHEPAEGEGEDQRKQGRCSAAAH